jgi:hypothetical protein
MFCGNSTDRTKRGAVMRSWLDEAVLLIGGVIGIVAITITLGMVLGTLAGLFMSAAKLAYSFWGVL